MQIRYAQRFGCRCSRWRTSRGEMRASGDSARENWSATYRCHSDGSCASAAAPRLTHANVASDRASTKVRRWCRLSSGSRSRRESGSPSDEEPSAGGRQLGAFITRVVRHPVVLRELKKSRASCGRRCRNATRRPPCSSAPTASTLPAGSRTERVLHRVVSLHPSLPARTAGWRTPQRWRRDADAAPADARDTVLAAYALNRVGASSEALVAGARGAARAGERAAAERARRDGARRGAFAESLQRTARRSRRRRRTRWRTIISRLT